MEVKKEEATGQKEEAKVYEYFATVATGTEDWAIEEITEKFPTDGIASKVPGKVWFKTSASVDRVKDLRSIERLYLSVAFNEWEPNVGPAPEDSIAYFREQTNKYDWTDALYLWEAFHNLPVDDATQEKESTEKKKHLSPLNGEITFRVTCKRSGDKTKAHTSKWIAGCTGAALEQKYPKWKVDLTNYDLDVYLHLNDKYFVLGLPVQGQRLSKRTYYQESGLKPSIAYCLCRAAGLSNTSSDTTTVLDPMCGVATILIEGKREWPNLVYFGGDIDQVQINKAEMNLKSSGIDFGDLFIWDCTNMPFKSDSISAVISDIPFGLRHGSMKDIRKLYPNMLIEVWRVLSPGGKAVILLKSRNLFERVLKSVEEEHHITWEIVRRWVNNGGLECHIYILTKKKPSEATTTATTATTTDTTTTTTDTTQQTTTVTTELESEKKEEQS